MKIPRISDPSVLVDVQHLDRGVVTLYDAENRPFRAYQSMFTMGDGKKYFSYLDANCAASVPLARFDADASLLRDHDLDLKSEKVVFDALDR